MGITVYSLFWVMQDFRSSTVVALLLSLLTKSLDLPQTLNPTPYNVGAVIVNQNRIGFWGILYYSYNKAPGKRIQVIFNYEGPHSTLCRLVGRGPKQWLRRWNPSGARDCHVEVSIATVSRQGPPPSSAQPWMRYFQSSFGLQIWEFPNIGDPNIVP